MIPSWPPSAYQHRSASRHTSSIGESLWEQGDERLSLLDDVGREFGTIAGTNVPDGMDRLGWHEHDFAGLDGCPPAIDFVLENSFEHVDDLFTGMCMPRSDVARVEGDSNLNELTPWCAEIAPLKI